LETGHLDNAAKEARAGLALSPTNPRTLGEAGYVLATTGHKTEATRILRRLKALFEHGSADPCFAALIEIGLGRHDQAVKDLEAHSKLVGLQGLSLWHAFDRLGSDPRYQQLIAAVDEMKAVKIDVQGSPPRSEQ
jgi:hypothetical protein